MKYQVKKFEVLEKEVVVLITTETGLDLFGSCSRSNKHTVSSSLNLAIKDALNMDGEEPEEHNLLSSEFDRSDNSNDEIMDNQEQQVYRCEITDEILDSKVVEYCRAKYVNRFFGFKVQKKIDKLIKNGIDIDKAVIQVLKDGVNDEK